MVNESDIDVSIWCLAYNQAPYIRQCLNGLLSQECKFRYEILIHDDASSDGTAKLIRDYHIKYPEIIKPIFQKENQWSNGRRLNIRYNLPRTKGRYIAFCEGDDYWTDPLKLQKQVDFLEAHPEYSFCATNYSILSEKGVKQVKLPKCIDSSNIFIKNRTATASLLFRKEVLDALSNIDYSEIIAGDWFIQAYACVYFNPGYVLPFDSCVYRKHNLGIWSQLNRKEMGLKGINVLENFKSKFDDPFIIREINKAIKLRNKEFGLQKKSPFITFFKKLLKF